MNETRTISPGTPSLDEAFRICSELTQSHYENFPVASLFLPQEKRPYVQSIYAFSRIADDFADELARPREDRLRDLDDWEEGLLKCYRGEAEHPVFVALGDTVRKLDIPQEPLKDLLNAFRQDVTVNRYQSFEELLGYCRCSANPVGRLVLVIFGYRDEELFRLSDKICTALQLANFWQDLSVDRGKDRLYVPLEDMARFGVSIPAWREGRAEEGFAPLMKFEIARTRALFYEGAELLKLVERDLRLELSLIWLGGMTILRKEEKDCRALLGARPRLSLLEKTGILMKGLLMNDVSRYGRKRPQWDLT
jgi:squalene synthase HpnC